MLRKCVIALSVVALLAGSVSQSKAAPITPVVVSSSAGAGAGLAVAGGFIGLVAVLCVYDIGLKIQGVKNWDGTPKLQRHGQGTLVDPANGAVLGEAMMALLKLAVENRIGAKKEQIGAQEDNYTQKRRSRKLP